MQPPSAKVNRNTLKNKDMLKSIKVSPATRRVLEKTYGVSHQYIWYALNYVKNGPSAERIRKAALDLGGVFTSSDFTPNCRVSHADNKIVQDFGGDVILTINRKTGELSVSDNGNTVASMYDVNIDGWAAMAKMAQKIAYSRIVSK